MDIVNPHCRCVSAPRRAGARRSCFRQHGVVQRKSRFCSANHRRAPGTADIRPPWLAIGLATAGAYISADRCREQSQERQTFARRDWGSCWQRQVRTYPQTTSASRVRSGGRKPSVCVLLRLQRPSRPQRRQTSERWQQGPLQMRFRATAGLRPPLLVFRATAVREHVQNLPCRCVIATTAD